MRVFLTGATGFIGSHLVPELLGAGHRVAGLCRSVRGATALSRAGAEVVRGDLADLDLLRSAAQAADGVVHAGFGHGSNDLQAGSEHDRSVVATLGRALGPGRPLVVSSGTGLARPQGPEAVETDQHYSSAEFPRGATEEASDALAAAGVHVTVMRLAQIHDTAHFGRIDQHIALARRHGHVAYIGDGAHRLPGAHVTDTVRLYRLALEHGRAGARYHAVAESGVRMREIAEVIGAVLDLPVTSITPDHAGEYFGAMARLAARDLAASSTRTRTELGWDPAGPGLLADLRAMRLDRD